VEKNTLNFGIRDLLERLTPAMNDATAVSGARSGSAAKPERRMADFGETAGQKRKFICGICK
jgi:hypothetical protein